MKSTKTNILTIIMFVCVLLVGVFGCNGTSSPAGTTPQTSTITHEQALQQAVGHLQEAQRIIADVNKSAIPIASVIAQGVEVGTGNVALVGLTQQATTLATSVNNSVLLLTPVASNVPVNTVISTSVVPPVVTTPDTSTTK
jgi:hypothetical protein